MDYYTPPHWHTDLPVCRRVDGLQLTYRHQGAKGKATLVWVVKIPAVGAHGAFVETERTIEPRTKFDLQSVLRLVDDLWPPPPWIIDENNTWFGGELERLARAGVSREDKRGRLTI